jgi:hypothetical protein
MQPVAANDLPRKLGLVPGIAAALLNDRHGIAEVIGDLPDGVGLAARISRGTRLALFVTTTLAEVQASLDRAHAQLDPAASFWIIHPKSNAQRRMDFNQNHVRELGLAAGYVDYKVAAIDAEWSALKFATRKSPGSAKRKGAK